MVQVGFGFVGFSFFSVGIVNEFIVFSLFIFLCFILINLMLQEVKDSFINVCNLLVIDFLNFYMNYSF